MVLRQGEIQPMDGGGGAWCVFSAHSCCPAELGISPSPWGALALPADPETPRTLAPSSRCCTCPPLSSAQPGNTSLRPFAGNSAALEDRESKSLDCYICIFIAFFHLNCQDFSSIHSFFWSFDILLYISIGKCLFFFLRGRASNAQTFHFGALSVTHGPKENTYCIVELQWIPSPSTILVPNWAKSNLVVLYT